MIVARHEMEEGEQNTWYDAWGEEAASDFELYIDWVFWATWTMTSIGFGDIIPLTNMEKIAALLVMIIGASTYGALFGSFVKIIDDLN